MPAVAFSKRVTPFQRRERRHELAILVLAAHQQRFLVEQISVVHGAFGKQVHFLLRTLQILCQFIDTPVVVSIFQCTGRVLINLYIVRHITQFVVIFISQTAGRRHLRMHVFSSMNQTFIKRFQIIHLYTLEISIHQNRSRVVSDHATAMSRACPFGEEAAFLICIDQSFLDFLVDRRIDQVQQREQTAERIPETCIGIHISRNHLTVVRAVMNNLSLRVYFVELTREKQ